MDDATTTGHATPEGRGAVGTPPTGIAFFRGMRAATTLLTRAPVGGFPYSDLEWRWAAAHLPAVGALLGVVSSGVWLASLRAGPLVAAAVVTLASLVATGAIHEDGLADTADALGGGRTRERVLAILKDSRIGAFGSAALTMALVLRVTLIARLGLSAPLALVFTGAASRLAPVWLMVALPYVTDPSVARSGAVVAAGRAQGLVATGWVALLTVAIGVGHGFGRLGFGHLGFGHLGRGGVGLGQLGLGGVDLALVWVVAIVVAIAGGRMFHARVGGITGDFLGAAQQVGECTMLLALAIAHGGLA
jgi:adenosylcobinamide-GDP ribazoletransferase